jgi:ABC-type dipeptide/oligopeptide/nickel transport system permease subunit
MASEGRSLITQAPLVSLAPAAAIAVLVISIHLISDALATALGDQRHIEKEAR